MILHALFTWLPLILLTPMAVGVLYLLIGTLMEPDYPDEPASIWDDDDWTLQAERGGW